MGGVESRDLKFTTRFEHVADMLQTCRRHFYRQVGNMFLSQTFFLSPTSFCLRQDRSNGIWPLDTTVALAVLLYPFAFHRYTGDTGEYNDSRGACARRPTCLDEQTVCTVFVVLCCFGDHCSLVQQRRDRGDNTE